MKYKTAFRLALKVVGVWIAVQGLAGLVHAAVPFVPLLTEFFTGFSRGGMGGLTEWALASILGNATSVILGLYLFFGGEWIVRRAIPSNRPYCVECGYELTGLPSDRVCPECGTPIKLAASGPQSEPP